MAFVSGLASRQLIGLVLGPLVFLAYLTVMPVEMPRDAAMVFAGTLWIAIWWVSEAIPISATALSPIVLFPMTGVVSVRDATLPYADPIVFLLLGGFMLALAVERWNLHERLALVVMRMVGTSARRLILGFMVATGGLSMWISNTATAMMMVPIGAAVIVQYSVMTPRLPDPFPDHEDAEIPLEERIVHSVERVTQDLPSSNFGLAVMLGIAYGASIGGAATLIGSPPNAILAGVAESALGIQIGFARWMMFALPVSAVFLLGAWAFLVTVLPPEVEAIDHGTVVEDRLSSLGKMSTGEKRTLLVFGIVVAGWISRPFLIEPLIPSMTDSVIAIIGAILLFLIPVDRKDGTFLLDWESTARLPWGVLLLLGAGFSIANAFQESGLDQWIAQLVAAMDIIALPIIILVIATLIVFLTEVNSNTATASVFIPIMIGVSAALGISPLTLMAVTALAASYAFMLPVATPPNAIVFGSGYMTVPEMAKVGFWLNLAGVVIVTGATYLWLPFVFG